MDCPSESKVAPHRIRGLNHDMHQKIDARWVVPRWQRIQELVSRHRHARDEGVILKEAVHALLGRSRCHTRQLRRVMRHAKSIEEGLEAVIEISAVDYGSRLFPSKEDHVEATGQLMRTMDDGNEAEATEPHHKKEGLQRSGHLDLAALENTFWKCLGLRLMELRLLGA